jgi:hypothetical protein
MFISLFASFSPLVFAVCSCVPANSMGQKNRQSKISSNDSELVALYSDLAGFLPQAAANDGLMLILEYLSKRLLFSIFLCQEALKADSTIPGSLEKQK